MANIQSRKKTKANVRQFTGEDTNFLSPTVFLNIKRVHYNLLKMTLTSIAAPEFETLIIVPVAVKVCWESGNLKASATSCPIASGLSVLMKIALELIS